MCAKLTPELQDQTAKAESSGFDPLPPGAYHATLRDVDTTKSGSKGPYWSWEFEIVDEGEVETEIEGEKKMISLPGRRLWNNTSLSDKAAFKMKETFEAFGVPLDTDTDELIGKPVKLVVSQRTIQEGTRRGELANQIDRLKPPDQDVVDRLDSQRSRQKEVEEIF